MVLMVLSEDYTPKSTVVESRRIPWSVVAFWGLSGVFPSPPQGIPDGTCREFVKKWRIYPPAGGPGGDPSSSPFAFHLRSGGSICLNHRGVEIWLAHWYAP